MARKFFGTDGIRGRTNQGFMTAAMAMAVVHRSTERIRFFMRVWPWRSTSEERNQKSRIVVSTNPAWLIT